MVSRLAMERISSKFCEFSGSEVIVTSMLYTREFRGDTQDKHLTQAGDTG